MFSQLETDNYEPAIMTFRRDWCEKQMTTNEMPTKCKELR